MACDDEAEWLTIAMTDDSTVAELLLRIRRGDAPPHAAAARSLKLDWTVRQRRSSNSKPAPKDTWLKKGAGEPARASPTTPLSWSGATSTSGGGGGGGGGGGEEECSIPVVKSPEKARSKTTNGSTTTSAATPSKRPRKKKTLAELREEENKLLKERRRLRWGVANLRLVVEKQRLANQSLKKMKIREIFFESLDADGGFVSAHSLMCNVSRKPRRLPKSNHRMPVPVHHAVAHRKYARSKLVKDSLSSLISICQWKIPAEALTRDMLRVRAVMW